MTKKLLAFFLVIFIALSFSGCRRRSYKFSNDSGIAEIKATAGEVLKVNDIAKNISVNGIKFSIPCKISDLPEGVTYIELDAAEIIPGKWVKNIALINGDEQIGCAGVAVEDDKIIHQDDSVKVFVVFSNTDKPEHTFLIGKITEKSTREEVENAYGKGDLRFSTETQYIYRLSCTEKECAFVSFDENNKVSSVGLYYI